MKIRVALILALLFLIPVALFFAVRRQRTIPMEFILGVRYASDNKVTEVVKCYTLHHEMTLRYFDGGPSIKDEYVGSYIEDFGGTRLSPSFDGKISSRDWWGVFYAVTATNLWLGVEVVDNKLRIRRLVGNKLFPVEEFLLYEPNNEWARARIAAGLGLQRTAVECETNSACVFDMFLCDGNSQLVYRSFRPYEKYFTYNAYTGKNLPVSKDDILNLKKKSRDAVRLYASFQARYWTVRNEHPVVLPERVRPLDSRGFAVPLWRSASSGLEKREESGRVTPTD